MGSAVLIYLNKVTPFPTALGEVAIVTGSQTYGEGSEGRWEVERRGRRDDSGGGGKRLVGGWERSEGAVCLSFRRAVVPHHLIKPFWAERRAGS